jgi:hypothetical protein
MASPLKPGKQPVALAADGVRVSRIRRDPPPVIRQTVVPDREIVDRRAVAVGILAFALALIVAIVGLASWAGWTPSQYTIHIRLQ